MSMIWRSTMPLLSTLAALVIIVHSAEEELDPGFRKDLRPRAVDPGTNSYEQPWKAIDADPLVQQSTRADVWDESPEEPAAQRRPVRKRKRRPQTSSEAEPDERYREGSQGSYPDTEYHDSYQTTELTRRRRKRPDVRPHRWADDSAEKERPLRRRGLRKKRPTLDQNAQLSELNDWNPKYDEQEHHPKTKSYLEGNIHTHYDGPDFYDKVYHTNTGYTRIADDSKEAHYELDQQKITVSNEMHIFKDSPNNYSSEDAFENRAKPKKIQSSDVQYVTQENHDDLLVDEIKKRLLRPKPLAEFPVEKLFSKSTEKTNTNINKEFEKAQEKLVTLGSELTLKDDVDIRLDDSGNHSEYIFFKDDVEKHKCKVNLDCAELELYTVYKKLLENYKIKVFHTQQWLEKVQYQYNDQTEEEHRQSYFMDEDFEDYDPIDPYTLKQILKRSNGTSLSEILQRHNLSLTDLLHGKGAALTLLNTDVSQEHQFDEDSLEGTYSLKKAESKYTQSAQTTTKEQVTTVSSLNKDKDSTELVPGDTDIDKTENKIKKITGTERRDSHLVNTEQPREMPRMTTKRRFPTGIRRKLRMRPMLNRTVKAQLSKDLIAMSAIKYSPNNRNVSKSREWKEVLPVMFNRSKSSDDTSSDDESALTTTETVIDTTLLDLEAWNSSYTFLNDTESSNVKSNDVENISISTTEPTTTLIIEVLPSEINSGTEKPKLTPIVRPAANNSALRRQAFNNRLKRKRQKQQSSTTENPSDDLTKNFYGMANLVSASQFIERTQRPHTTITQDNTEYGTELEDFMTTQVPTTVEDVKYTRITTSKYVSPSMTFGPLSSTITTTTEQSAKFEIEEILNDTMTSERLAKILQERNMTLGELVKHRERGSSHVHLADIFHNASKEPNPPEPFLTKSSIEPISKETYPLRAILEANTHDASTKPTTLHTSSAQGNYMHIPVVMDFGNNVNENGENIGIISLFNKFTGNDISEDKVGIRQDSDGTPYVSSVISVNTTNPNDTNRESRILSEHEDLKGWKILLSLVGEHNINATGDSMQAMTEANQPTDKSKTSLEEDIDGDGLIILEDLQHLKDFDSNIASASDEKLDIKMFERSETITEKPGILNKSPSNTRSVAIATASILGLATILFLLTYVVLKYKQQRVNLRKKDSFCDERIPSPVFEHRKGHKNNCSSRSISPMISNSNIYTMSTLDSHTGKESPDYMWNSLRKPFQ